MASSALTGSTTSLLLLVLQLYASHGYVHCLQSKVAYHSKEIEGFQHKYANPPTPVKENFGSVMDAIKQKFPEMRKFT